MRSRKGFSLAELVVVVAMLGIMAAVAIPRLPFDVLGRKQTEVAAAKLAADLRLTRQLAITHAATNRQGVMLEMAGDAPYRTYRIINRRTGEIVASGQIDSRVNCTGSKTVTFDSLGALAEGQARLMLSADGMTATLTVVPATGAVMLE